MRKLVASLSWMSANENTRSETRCRGQVKITARKSRTCIGHECNGDDCALELLLNVQRFRFWWGGSFGKHSFINACCSKGTRSRAITWSSGRRKYPDTIIQGTKNFRNMILKVTICTAQIAPMICQLSHPTTRKFDNPSSDGPYIRFSSLILA